MNGKPAIQRWFEGRTAKQMFLRDKTVFCSCLIQRLIQCVIILHFIIPRRVCYYYGSMLGVRTKVQRSGLLRCCLARHFLMHMCMCLQFRESANAINIVIAKSEHMHSSLWHYAHTKVNWTRDSGCALLLVHGMIIHSIDIFSHNWFAGRLEIPTLNYKRFLSSHIYHWLTSSNTNQLKLAGVKW